eukprot:5867648-Amphidinium_carterae.1
MVSHKLTGGWNVRSKTPITNINIRDVHRDRMHKPRNTCRGATLLQFQLTCARSSRGRATSLH